MVSIFDEQITIEVRKIKAFASFFFCLSLIISQGLLHLKKKLVMGQIQINQDKTLMIILTFDSNHLKITSHYSKMSKIGSWGYI